MAAFGGYEILVTPEELAAKATVVSGYIKNIKSNFENIESLMTSSTSFWTGEAGDHFREYYQRNKENIENSVTHLLAIPQMLQEISGVYTVTENAVTEISESLPGEIIF